MALISNEKYSLYYQRISLIYRQPEVKASLEIILSVFVVTILIFAAIRPTLTNITTLQKRIEDLESVNKKADNKIAQVFNAQKQLGSFQDKLILYDRAVPNKFSYQAVAARIELLAKGHNLSVQTVVLPGIRLFGTSKAEAGWSAKILTQNASKIVSSGVSFTVSGSPREVREFMADLENMDMVTLLERVVMTTEVGPAGGSTSLKAVGQINFYFYLENET